MTGTLTLTVMHWKCSTCERYYFCDDISDPSRYSSCDGSTVAMPLARGLPIGRQWDPQLFLVYGQRTPHSFVPHPSWPIIALVWPNHLAHFTHVQYKQHMQWFRQTCKLKVYLYNDLSIRGQSLTPLRYLEKSDRFGHRASESSCRCPPIAETRPITGWVRSRPSPPSRTTECFGFGSV